MPVNMDPAKKRRSSGTPNRLAEEQDAGQPEPLQSRNFGEETSVDKEKDLADAEWKNLWDATEVIDMDKI